MTNPFSRWFGSGKGRESPSEVTEEGLELRLEKLEAEAEAAADGFKGLPLNRAGDLCFRSGEKDRALSYFGRAIDAYLADEQPEAARAVAQKLIRLHPGTIRTLCTLTWLDLSAGHLGDALLHLGEYVEAARRGDRQALAHGQVMEMVRLVDDDQFRRTAAEGLEDLGFPDDAKLVRGWVGRDDAPGGAENSAELRARSFAAAVGSNADRPEGDAEGGD